MNQSHLIRDRDTVVNNGVKSSFFDVSLKLFFAIFVSLGPIAGYNKPTMFIVNILLSNPDT